LLLSIKIYDLYYRQDCIPTLAVYHKSQWEDSGPDRMALFHSRATFSDIPKTFVAMKDNNPVGFISLIKSNVPSQPDLTPWLVSLYVHEDFRQQGIGRALVDKCIEHASVAGFSKVYLYTSTAVQYYLNFGWVIVGEVEVFGKIKTILCNNV